MIHAVDESLRALVRRDALGGTDVEVVLDAPTKDWGARRTNPTVDIYLYDIREDLRMQQYGLVDERQDGLVTQRVRPPRRFKLSYLVTAWTQRPEDEHHLLSALLGCFVRHDHIPAELLVGPLDQLGVPIPVTIAQPPPQDRALSDVWSALGGELKPSLDLVVMAPWVPAADDDIAPPVQHEPTLHFSRLGGIGPETVMRRSRSGKPDVAPAPDAPAQAVTGGPEPGPGRIVRTRDKRRRT
ncbi:MAG: hypothetical protein QOF96_3047 [Actinomycetota bacterium]|nr:hypothetical protein [Actinomycetota bacterium]